MGFLDQLFGRARRRREGAEDESFEARMSDPEHRKRVVYAYHEQTKHNVHRFAVGPHELDWDNQPDPFRRWEGAQLLSLDVVPPTEQPGYFEALEEGGVAPASLGRQLISQLLYDSLALSAWKQVGDVRWALRVNPSSGNLHPTEGYLLVPAIPDLCDTPAVLHYAPREHGLELRARIPQDLWDRLAAGLPHGSFFAGLASIHWREAWKYGERAFRYCQHDAGHAIAALSVAAAGVGWKAELIDDLDSDELAQLLGIHGEQGPDAEQPDTLLLLTPQGNTVAPRTFPTLANEFRDLAWQGVANDLSSEHVDWDAIDLTASASRKPRSKPYARWQPSQRALAAQGKRVSLRETIRQRRSCQTLDGRTSMPA
ncbi:MAG: SagB-type dehydrogenase family enzyme, partial [Chlamydiales bacterium]